MDLRELRMWHWDNAMQSRRMAKIALNSRCNEESDFYNKRADLHIRAVQALNDVVDGTAEQDCARRDGQ